MSEHRLGINSGYLTRHTLSLKGLNESNADAIFRELDELPCMDSVLLNKDRKSLKIAYDASHHDIDEMLSIIEKHGASVKSSWWSQFKLNWQRQTDENIKANAKHEPHCCNKAPRR